MMREWITTSGQKIEKILGGRCNVFLISHNNRTALIDTSTKSKAKKLNKELSKKGIAKIDYLILTHLHFDHVANANMVKEKYGTKIMIHRNANKNALSGRNEPTGGGNPFTKRIYKWTDPLSDKYSFETITADHLIDGEISLSELGFNGCIIETPGHSPFSISVIIENEVALVGDALFGVIKGKVYPPWVFSVTSMIKSSKKLIDTNCEIYLPSHGGRIKRATLIKNYEKRCRTTAST